MSLSVEQISEQIKKGFHVQTKPFLLEAYRTIFKQEVSNPKCSSCLHDAFSLIAHYLKKEGIMEPVAKKYICLVPFVTIRGMSSELMTDVQIEEYIKSDPRNSIFYFKKIETKEKKVKLSATDEQSPSDTI